MRRRRGPGDTPPPPTPRSPSEPPSPSSATRGRGRGGRRDDRGRGGALSAWAQLRWRGEVPGAAAAAAAASGEPARASAASGLHTAEALSVPRRGPSAGGRAHAQPSATTTTPGKGALTKGRAAAGRPADGGAGSPKGREGLRGSWVPRALGPRTAQASGAPPLSSGRRRHRLTPPPSLSLRPLKPQNPTAAQVPPFPDTPPDSHPRLRSREISLLTGPTLRETRLRTRARPHGNARILSLGGVSRAAPSLSFCPAWPNSGDRALLPHRRQVHSFHPEI